MNLSRVLGILIAIGISVPALAQDDLEEVVVTGSYVARPADRPQPITVLDSVSIENEQRLTVGEIFRDLNVTQGNYNGMNAAGENATSPTSAVNLRGLGPRATLTLLNGRRQTLDANELTSWVDVNSLAPAIMVDRIEVLTDGASALYGSDAVAGVVNMITRNDFEGIEFEYSGSQVDRAGAYSSSLGALFGAQGERSSIVFGIGYTDRPEVEAEDLFSLERLQSRPPVFQSNPPTLYPVPGMASVPDPLCEDPRIGGPEVGGVIAGNGRVCGYRLAMDRTIASQATRTTGLGIATHDFGGGVSGQLELGFSTTATSRILNSIPFARAFPTLPILQTGHPGLAYEVANGNLNNVPHRVRFRIRKPNDPYIARETQESHHWRLAPSLDGSFNDTWDWQASGTISRNRMFLTNRDYLRDRVLSAIAGYGGPPEQCDRGSGGASGYGPDATPGTGDDGDIDPDCMWYNPLANSYLASPGDPHYNDPAVKDYIYIAQQAGGVATLRTLEFLVTGNPADWIGVAVGAQQRDQDFNIDFDPIYEAGGYAWRNQIRPDFNGDIVAQAVFAEAVFFPTDDLEIQLATRSEQYDNDLGAVVPKIGLLWTPTDTLYFRATAGSSYRIAGPAELFGINIAGAPQFNSLSPDGVESGVIAGTVQRGSPNLDPEEADIFTLGFTWDATDSLTLDVNYWSIDFTNLIESENAGVVLFNDLQDGMIDDRERITIPPTVTNPCFEPTGDPGLWIECGDMSADDILGFEVSYVNQAFLNTDGFDIGADYRFDVGANNFGLQLDLTQTLTYELPSGARVIDGVGSLNVTNNGAPVAETKASLRLSWMRGNHFAQLTARHTSALDDDLQHPSSTEFDYNILDLVYRYSTEFSGNPLNLNIGVVNLADTEAPTHGDQISTYEGQVYDARGRIIRIGATMGFGQ